MLSNHAVSLSAHDAKCFSNVCWTLNSEPNDGSILRMKQCHIEHNYESKVKPGLHYTNAQLSIRVVSRQMTK